MTPNPRNPDWKLAALLYPFVAAAVAINLFMLGLLAPVVGLTPLSPVAAMVWSVFLGVPATWAATRWVRRLIDDADGNR